LLAQRFAGGPIGFESKSQHSQNRRYGTHLLIEKAISQATTRLGEQDIDRPFSDKRKKAVDAVGRRKIAFDRFDSASKFA